jgi:hypothetical protein
MREGDVVLAFVATDVVSYLLFAGALTAFLFVKKSAAVTFLLGMVAVLMALVAGFGWFFILILIFFVLLVTYKYSKARQRASA